jgi:hypothetical protein
MDSMENSNIEEFQDYLGAVHYPASRMSIINAARQRNAPSDIMVMLKELPDMTFGDYTEVSRRLYGIILGQRRIGPR